MRKRKNKSTNLMFMAILMTILIITLYSMNGGTIDLKSGVSKITGKVTSKQEVTVREVKIKVNEEKIYIDNNEFDLEQLTEQLNKYNKDEVVIKIIDSSAKRTTYSNVIEKLHEKNFIIIEEKE